MCCSSACKPPTTLARLCLHFLCLPACLAACSTYLFVATITAPWHGAAGDSSGGHRRRLLSSAGSDDADALSASSAALQVADQAALRLLRRQLGKARRVLAAAAGGASDGTSMPQLTVQIMQKNVTKTAPRPSPAIDDLLASVIPPTDYGMTPVSQAFTCQLKDGASVKCNMAITSSHMTPALRPGENLYLVFSLDTPGQVRGLLTGLQASSHCRDSAVSLAGLAQLQAAASCHRPHGSTSLLNSMCCLCCAEGCH